MDEVEQLSVRQTTAYIRPGELGDVMRVEFAVGKDGPYSVDIPASEFTPENVKLRVDAFVQNLADVKRALAQ